MVEWDGDLSPEPDELDELDVFDDSGAPGTVGSAAGARDAREAGDEGVEGLDKITAQMAGGEHRPEQQEMCRAVAEALVSPGTSSCRPGRGQASHWRTWSRPR